MSTETRAPDGYAHPLYARSLSEFGDPLELPRSQGWLLRRQIPGTDAADAMGCYPLFACGDWSRLGEDIEHLEGLVSLVLVIDSLGNFDAERHGRHFDEVRPFKPHYVTDLSLPVERIASPHHRKYARRGLRQLKIERHPSPPDLLAEWTALYGLLVERKGITGIKAFSRESFSTQLETPGTVMVVARLDGKLVGAHWYLADGPNAYAHLAALAPEAYRLNASYALHWRGIELLAELGVRWLDLGGASGRGDVPADGLGRFKRGWSTATRPAYLATRIFDQGRYDELSCTVGDADGYFPAYRAAELA